ncbi:alkene reductase [Pelagicoccus sp. SDUM812002]|uniref:alkene reductase n=1 Tax=Pelagicoccus sp. SDUM812002 TaxID=3041266 RepID=UPI002810B7A5|nr:alkene reductase [Pelagicoccus sp. SDUM812002]
MSNLQDPIKVGAWELPNRVIMAPLTRCRASEGRIPNALMADYYSQRSTAGLIISEATSVEAMGVGYANTPGIWSDEQVEGWKLVTKAVHDKGGLIILQLWHVGRISDPMYLDGELPVAPSAIKPEGHVSHVRPEKEFVTPRALELEEIPDIVEAYRKGAENAKKAGFDGVEIHGANGYLLDQFLQDSTNKREDQYGGSIENRARLMLEVTDAVLSVWDASRVGMHLAPACDAHDMGDSNPSATFGYVAEELGKRGIAFIFTREAIDDGSVSLELKKKFGGIYIANQGLTAETGARLVKEGVADAVSYGQLFIANPDLVKRLKEGAPLNEPDPDSFYSATPKDPKGYVDYPSLEDANV